MTSVVLQHGLGEVENLRKIEVSKSWGSESNGGTIQVVGGGGCKKDNFRRVEGGGCNGGTIEVVGGGGHESK